MPGWVWPAGSAAARRWVINGERVPDSQISGVFVRRATVYPDELLTVHPDDRPYLAAEAHAFLIYVLATTGALVANPVGDGAIGEEAIRPEAWMPMAVRCGLTLAPLRLVSGAQPRRSLTTHVVEVVGTEAFGEASRRCRRGAAQMVAALGLVWAVCVFDGRHRLATVTSAATPSAEASVALVRMLGGEPA
ncbi:MAG: hypothetical protein WCC60_06830 [Ilumatobacteraceae bacterium]